MAEHRRSGYAAPLDEMLARSRARLDALAERLNAGREEPPAVPPPREPTPASPPVAVRASGERLPDPRRTARAGAGPAIRGSADGVPFTLRPPDDA